MNPAHHPWLVPLILTGVVWIAAVIVAYVDLTRQRGDLSMPLLGFGALFGAAVTTVVTWGTFALLHFTK